jgi:hypothetical protein
LFIYYNTRVIENTVNEDSGTTISGALTVLRKQGACPEPIWPYNISQYAVKPSTEAYASGSKHLMSVYARVLLDLAQMKQCLLDGFPFVFGVLLYSSFENVGISGVVPIPRAGEQLLGGHCMACVGFNDAAQQFIVRNSWGSNWGAQGYCYIPYAYLTNSDYMFDMWTIRTVSDTEVSTSTITNVTYGKKTRVKDVTTIFNNYFSSGKTSFPVENNLLTDPYPGVVKELRITFSNGALLIYQEHAMVTLSQISNTPNNIVSATNISKAMYGKKTKYTDVTTLLKNQFSQGTYQVKVNNTLFGDPIVGTVKELILTLSNNTTKKFVENSYITINDIVV